MKYKTRKTVLSALTKLKYERSMSVIGHTLKTFELMGVFLKPSRRRRRRKKIDGLIKNTELVYLRQMCPQIDTYNTPTCVY